MVTDALLRPALEAALAVAREGEDETPSIPAPPALRPFLRFAKLPPRALAVARRALEGDDEFRARVAGGADEDEVGRAGWLYLTRPDGWEEELEVLVAGAEETAREHADRRAEHDARRRLAGAQQAARRADEATAAARAEAAEAAAALAEERRARQAAVEAAATAARQAEDVVAERDRARAALAAATAEVSTLRQRVADLEKERRDRQSPLDRPAPAPAPTPLPAARAAPPALPVPVPAPAAPAPRPAGDRRAGAALDHAAEAALQLADALRAARSALEEPIDTEPQASPPRPLVLPPPPPPAPARRRAPAAVMRQPAPLPPAVYDDSLEAADHLLRVAGMVLVVDGYNVSQAGWPGFSIAEQRRRLVDALVALAARTGADARVVFDGADVVLPGVVATTAKPVHVSFSPPGVEADDVVLDLVAHLPATRPVVVATSDRRVQEGARRAGGNVISTEQLLSLLRR